MRSTPSLARPAVWLCLVGSTLALGSFFLPFYGSPAGSLWVALLYYLNPEYLSSEVLLIFWLGLLLLLLGVGTLAGWVACLSPPKWDILGIYLASTGMALFWNVITALVFVFITLTLTTNYGQPFSDVLGNAHLGIILMPLGLMLALWGGNRLDRKKPKQAIKS